MQIWDISLRCLAFQVPIPNAADIWTLQWSPDSSFVSSLASLHDQYGNCWRRTLSIQDAATGSCLSRTTLYGKTHHVTWLPSGSGLVLFNKETVSIMSFASRPRSRATSLLDRLKSSCFLA